MSERRVHTETLSFGATTPQSSLKTVVMAGNPRVEIGRDGVMIDAQHLAVRQALAYVQKNRAQIARIYMSFDHIGPFIEQFVDKTQPIPNRQRKHLKLGMLLPEIKTHYQEALDTAHISPDEVHLITEEQCRAGAIQSRHKPSENRGLCRLRPDACQVDRINCTEISAEIIARMARHGNDLRLFWVKNNQRCIPEIIEGGTKLAKDIYPLEGINIEHLFLKEVAPWF